MEQFIDSRRPKIKRSLDRGVIDALNLPQYGLGVTGKSSTQREKFLSRDSYSFAQFISCNLLCTRPGAMGYLAWHVYGMGHVSYPYVIVDLELVGTEEDYQSSTQDRLLGSYRPRVFM